MKLPSPSVTRPAASVAKNGEGSVVTRCCKRSTTPSNGNEANGNTPDNEDNTKTQEQKATTPHTTPAQPKTLRSLRGDRSSTPDRNKRTANHEPPDRTPKAATNKGQHLPAHTRPSGGHVLVMHKPCMPLQLPPATRSTTSSKQKWPNSEQRLFSQTQKRKRCGSAHCCPSSRERTAQSTPQQRLAEERCNATANYLGVVSSCFLLAFLSVTGGREEARHGEVQVWYTIVQSGLACYRPHRHTKKQNSSNCLNP